jgi:fatty-acyl-CoA synthase
MFVVDWLHKQALLNPGKPALISAETGASITYRDLDLRASRFAEWLRERAGLAEGDRLAVLAHNGTEYLEMLYGCAKAGVVMVCLNWRLPAAELRPIVADAKPAAWVCGAAFAEAAAELREPELPGLMLGMPTEEGVAGALSASGAQPGSAAPAGATFWQSHEAAMAATSGRIIEMPTRPMDAPWYLLYTSGTTGRPKGVIQTFGMAFFNAVNAMLATRLSGEDTLLSALPFFHTGGLNLYANPILFAGGTVVVMRQFDAGEALRWLDGRACVGGEPLPITQFLGVPALYLFMAQHPDFASARFASMRHWSAGGSPMPAAVLETWSRKGVTICFGFGMTETGPTVFIPDERTARAKPGSVGKPVGTMLARVVDRSGRDCGPNERGELLVRGPGVTPGYWNDPQATADALREGWLHTGDVAYFDDDGDFWIVDRVKDMYISGGENVYPAEVENLLHRLDGVAEAAVIGVPDARWGEVGLAVIVRAAGAAGAALTEEAVRAFCRASLAGYKQPRHVRFVDALPRTPAGKVEKPALRERFGREPA